VCRVYVTYDRNSQYLGARGVTLRLNSRILVVVRPPSSITTDTTARPRPRRFFGGDLMTASKLSAPARGYGNNASWC